MLLYAIAFTSAAVAFGIVGSEVSENVELSAVSSFDFSALDVVLLTDCREFFLSLLTSLFVFGGEVSVLTSCFGVVSSLLPNI